MEISPQSNSFPIQPNLKSLILTGLFITKTKTRNISNTQQFEWKRFFLCNLRV